jgi:hypothetical protein
MRGMTDIIDPTPTPRDMLAQAVSFRDRLRAGVARAEQGALEAERARADAERQHAESALAALLDGQPAPVKPKALSAAQAMDDSADAALSLLSDKLREASGQVQTLGASIVAGGIRDLYAARADQGHRLAGDLVRVCLELASAVGTVRARMIGTAVADALAGRSDIDALLAGETDHLATLAADCEISYPETAMREELTLGYPVARIVAETVVSGAQL